jgi:putative endonuclease
MLPKDLGRKGEELAVRFLLRRKYRILERNYRRRSGEIDIVARDGRILVFVEVKTRASDGYALPIESVGFRKQQRLRRLAEHYLAEHDFPDCDVRFDVISIVDLGGRPRIEQIPNAF